MLKKIKEKLHPKSHSGNIALVTIGTVSGQAVLMLTTPIITRLYSPDEMGAYAVFASLIGIFSIILALHYELAIPLPKSKREARRILEIAFIVSFFVVALLSGGLAIIGKKLLHLIGTEELEPYIWLLPIGLSLYGASTILSFWSIRRGTFALTATAKGLQGVGQGLPQILAGFLNFGIFGLIIGQLTGQLSSIGALIWSLPDKNRERDKKNKLKKLYSTARKYRRFPLISTWSTLINTLTAHLPILVLSYFFGPVITGYYALSFRILQVPARFIGQSISQVFFSVAAQANRKQRLGELTLQIFHSLFAFGLPSFAFLALIAPELFSLFFGSEWRQAGLYARFLMPWIFSSFISTTLSILVSVLQKQSQELVFQGGLFIITISCLASGFITNSEIILIALLGICPGILLAIKVFWLISLTGISIKNTAIICLQESYHTIFFLIIFFISKTIFDHKLTSIISACFIIICAHLYNFKIRNVYKFTN